MKIYKQVCWLKKRSLLYPVLVSSPGEEFIISMEGKFRYPSTHPPVRLSVHPSVHPSIYPSVHLFHLLFLQQTVNLGRVGALLTCVFSVLRPVFQALHALSQLLNDGMGVISNSVDDKWWKEINLLWRKAVSLELRKLLVEFWKAEGGIFCFCGGQDKEQWMKDVW